MSKYHITDKHLLKEVLYNDYQIIKKMGTPEGNRIKILSTLFSTNPNSWRVVGITPEALEVFKKHNFKKVSGMGINRSHLIQRHSYYKNLLNMEIPNQQEFWEKYYNNDMTVLATSSENMILIMKNILTDQTGTNAPGIPNYSFHDEVTPKESFRIIATSKDETFKSMQVVTAKEPTQNVYIEMNEHR